MATAKAAAVATHERNHNNNQQRHSFQQQHKKMKTHLFLSSLVPLPPAIVSALSRVCAILWDALDEKKFFVSCVSYSCTVHTGIYHGLTTARP